MSIPGSAFQHMNTTPLISKPHYPILDGLRGVAAVTVVAFHICEANSTSPFTQIINHGYLAVDFFFLLSGFVVGYAYDDRWGKMSVGDFFRRRLIRLQPMVVLGMIVGGVCFYFQQGGLWPGISQVPVWKMLLVMLIGFTLIPLPPSMDIRGWAEMHPLDGPGWSLFFEYIANILYALIVRRFSNTLLFILVVLSAAALIHLAVTSPQGDLIGGWSIDPTQLRVGFSRVMYPFFAGLLLFRSAKIPNIKNAFLWSSLLIIVVLSIPRIGGDTHRWENGLYEVLVVIFIFPLIIYLGAGGEVRSKTGARICKFLGDISYPIYMTHYPLIYIYTAWVFDHKPSAGQSFGIGAVVMVFAITLAYASLKLFDEPVRVWLKTKFLNSK